MYLCTEASYFKVCCSLSAPIISFYGFPNRTALLERPNTQPPVFLLFVNTFVWCRRDLFREHANGAFSFSLTRRDMVGSVNASEKQNSTWTQRRGRSFIQREHREGLVSSRSRVSPALNSRNCSVISWSSCVPVLSVSSWPNTAVASCTSCLLGSRKRGII